MRGPFVNEPSSSTSPCQMSHQVVHLQKVSTQGPFVNEPPSSTSPRNLYASSIYQRALEICISKPMSPRALHLQKVSAWWSIKLCISRKSPYEFHLPVGPWAPQLQKLSLWDPFFNEPSSSKPPKSLYVRFICHLAFVPWIKWTYPPNQMAK